MDPVKSKVSKKIGGLPKANRTSNGMDLLAKLKQDFPDVVFTPGNSHFWSPHGQQITYEAVDDKNEASIWSLLHEVGHAVLGHSEYSTDFELLQLEAAAWDKASTLAKSYSLEIDEEHIQDCLDTYRDWLHRRSACPLCGNHSLQKDTTSYQCFNCQTVWKVSVSRFCRPYRRTQVKTS